MNRESVSLTFLGTGTSHGVPMIGCSCPTCSSDDERDRRSNASLMIGVKDKVILIDCGRDFRYQALRHRVPRVDYVLITHTHFDHIAGLDDLRAYNLWQGSSIPLFGRQEHLDYLQRYTFHYLFTGVREGGGVSDLELISIDGHFALEGIVFEPLRVLHGTQEIVGYKFLNCAYLCDVSHIPRETMQSLADLDLLILDALRYRPHGTHFSLSEALDVVRTLVPRQTWLTHISHDLMHREVEELLRNPESPYFTPQAVGLAWDGLTLQV